MIGTVRALIAESSNISVNELPNEVLPKRELDIEIILKSDEPPAVRAVIRLSSEEIKELEKKPQTFLDKIFIQPSSSSYVAPVFLLKRKRCEVRMVCDYRALNQIPVSDSDPLPLLSETIYQASRLVIFLQIDLLGAYHKMKIPDKDMHKTELRSRFGSFGWKVLCFGITNVRASFSLLMSLVLRVLKG